MHVERGFLWFYFDWN